MGETKPNPNDIHLNMYKTLRCYINSYAPALYKADVGRSIPNMEYPYIWKRRHNSPENARKR